MIVAVGEHDVVARLDVEDRSDASAALREAAAQETGQVGRPEDLQRLWWNGLVDGQALRIIEAREHTRREALADAPEYLELSSLELGVAGERIVDRRDVRDHPSLRVARVVVEDLSLQQRDLLGSIRDHERAGDVRLSAEDLVGLVRPLSCAADVARARTELSEVVFPGSTIQPGRLGASLVTLATRSRIGSSSVLLRS